MNLFEYSPINSVNGQGSGLKMGDVESCDGRPQLFLDGSVRQQQQRRVFWGKMASSIELTESAKATAEKAFPSLSSKLGQSLARHTQTVGGHEI